MENNLTPLELEMAETLVYLRLDAEMALNGSWDKSDIGFEAQTFYINRILSKLPQDVVKSFENEANLSVLNPEEEKDENVF